VRIAELAEIAFPLASRFVRTSSAVAFRLRHLCRPCAKTVGIALARVDAGDSALAKAIRRRKAE
jgi:hypothetical protein